MTAAAEPLKAPQLGATCTFGVEAAVGGKRVAALVMGGERARFCPTGHSLRLRRCATAVEGRSIEALEAEQGGLRRPEVRRLSRERGWW